MDRKQYRIIHYILLFFMLLIICSVLSGCFLLSWNRKEFKKPLLKSICVDEKNIVTIVLDNTNKLKRIGEIHSMELVYLGSILKYEMNAAEIIIKKDISKYADKFKEGDQYKIAIKWFGGHLFLKTIYQNGQFIVLDEHYTNGI